MREVPIPRKLAGRIIESVVSYRQKRYSAVVRRSQIINTVLVSISLIALVGLGIYALTTAAQFPTVWPDTSGELTTKTMMAAVAFVFVSFTGWVHGGSPLIDKVDRRRDQCSSAMSCCIMLSAWRR